MRFSAFLVFSLLWATLVYDPVAHWVWGIGGWIRNLGALDFAGGTVVHITSGVSALAAALVIGKRKGYGNGADAAAQPADHGASARPCSGSAGSASTPAARSAPAAWRVSAFVATNTAAAAATLAWMFAEWVHRGKPTVLGAASGASRGWSPSRPPPASSGRLRRSLIGLGGGVALLRAPSS